MKQGAEVKNKAKINFENSEKKFIDSMVDISM